MEKHFTLLGVLYVAFGIAGLLMAVVVFLAVGGGGLLSGDPQATAITTAVAIFVGGFLALLSIPSVVGGVGLLKRKSWSRLLLLVIGALNFLNVPAGTLLGIYTFWVLLKDESIRLLASAQHS